MTRCIHFVVATLIGAALLTATLGAQRGREGRDPRAQRLPTRRRADVAPTSRRSGGATRCFRSGPIPPAMPYTRISRA